ncbi:hypothetical protein N5F23_13955 [Pseudomonas sichuanensis]|uniref:hypothetical protein n=1 Tax=Pseudomonas sichuanensis TaxID=2213015 RepID=UPI002449B675|nr:hypothetical protein [Pseudomonas sichuanensis]MDH0730383.1 hypothetical protein [Pseudomonas sichuanensis]MDH1583686.1 hypothetical protein [Pseudomonas sichuanensis]MDH1594233.1 hypothetical protein [Pseudomonas sichuanensis]MDH1597858.1 hypothetical protein [Pseudomonas sichuanensis]
MASKQRITRSRSEHPNKHTDNPIGLVPPTIPDLVPDIEGQIPNVVSFRATILPLRVEFPMWPFSMPSEDTPEYVFLYRKQELLAQKVWTQPVKPDELFVLIPPHYLYEGYHELHYVVRAFNDTEAPSLPLTLYVDKTPPLLNLDDDRLQYPDEVIRDGVTEMYLEYNNDILIGTVPPYLGAEPGDTLKWFWSDDPAGQDIVGIKVLGKDDVELLDAKRMRQIARRHVKVKDMQFHSISKPIELEFPGSAIRRLGKGSRFSRYEVQDRAGTTVQRSQARTLMSDPSPEARAFAPPRIKEAQGSEHFSTLLPRDATGGVTLQIPDSAVIRPDEHFHVYWGTPGTPGAFNTSTPVTPGSREYPIPKKSIAPYMRQQVPAYYEIIRNGQKVDESGKHYVTVRVIEGLPYVQCVNIQSGELNLRNLTGNAVFTLDDWPFRDTTQYVNAWIDGIERADVSKSIRLSIADQVPVTTEAGRMQLGSVTPAELQKLALNYQFRVSVEVSFDNKASWLKFPSIEAVLVDRAP